MSMQHLPPLYLGIKAVLVKSFARIHCANLANAGLIPLQFVNESDYDTFEQGDSVSMPNVKAELAEGCKITILNKTKNTEIIAEAILTDRQRQMVIEGGLLNYTKNHN